MSYQALYRKWRPVTFDQVRGQDAVVITLKNQIVSDRTGHAYLFCGTRGTGKTSVAKIFARAVNCPHAKENGGNPCNECEECRSISSGSSINVFEIDAASNNGVDNIRDIRDQIEYPPSSGRYKIYIIDEVHMLSTGAFNALLKTLEEPPAYVIFILATTDPQKIPQTILSRCQRYDFRRIPKKKMTEYLLEVCREEKADIDPAAVSYIAGLGDGSMRDALSLLDQCLGYHRESTLTYDDVLEILGCFDTAVCSGLFRAVTGGQTMEALRIVDRMLSSGQEPVLLITEFIRYLRNILLASDSSIPEDMLDVPEDRIGMLREDSALLPSSGIIPMLTRMAELLNRCRFAPQKKLLLEVELIRLCSENPGRRADPRIRIDLKPAAEEVLPENTVPSESAVLKRIKASSERSDLYGTTELSEKKAPQRKEEGSAVYETRPQSNMQNKLPDSIPGGSRLDIIRNNWDMLVSGLDASNRSLFMTVGITEDRDNIVLVFKNKINYRMAASNTSENGLIRLRELAAEKLGIAVSFLARVATRDELMPENNVISDEDLSKINFPISFDNN